MKICITGSFSTGKTTLATGLSKYFGIPFPQSDRAKDIGQNLQKEKRINELSFEEKWELQKQFLLQMIKSRKNLTTYVTDCSTFTWNPYNKYLLGENNFTSLPEYEKYYQLAENEKEIFDVIFYLPPEIPLEDDSFRPASKKDRFYIDREIIKNLTGYEYYQLTGSIEERLNTAVDILEQLGYKK
ncbi:MAG: ATP-binding protein [Alphaproteobacteria bacterium]|nr:ATP-binding protein [Alphaproteobacteria bacterium]